VQRSRVFVDFKDVKKFFPLHLKSLDFGIKFNFSKEKVAIIFPSWTDDGECTFACLSVLFFWIF